MICLLNVAKETALLYPLLQLVHPYRRKIGKFGQEINPNGFKAGKNLKICAIRANVEKMPLILCNLYMTIL